MEEKYSSEKSVDFQRTTRLYIPEDRTPHIVYTLSYKSDLYLTEERSKLLVTNYSCGHTLFYRLKNGIVGSRPTKDMEVRLGVFCVCDVLCRQKLCAGPISRPRRPNKQLSDSWF
jgi:hypothetical protein